MNVAVKEELDLLEKYIVQSYEYNKSNEIKQNPPCMKMHGRVSQYWEAKSNRTLNSDLHKLLSIKSAQLMQKTSFWVLLSFLFFIVFVSYRA